MRNVSYLVHKDIPRVDLWFKLIVASILSLTLMLGVLLLFEDIIAASVMFAVTLFDALLLKAITPRRYEIYNDRVRIVLGGPFAFNIPFYNIKEARPACGKKALAYRGLRLATSNKGVVEIIREKGLNVVISPSDRDTFLEQLSQAH